MIEKVLLIMNAPTNTATNANTSKKILNGANDAAERRLVFGDQRRSPVTTSRPGTTTANLSSRTSVVDSVDRLHGDSVDLARRRQVLLCGSIREQH